MSLPELLADIGFMVSDADLQAAAIAVGGPDVLLQLESPQSSAAVVGPAWISFLDALRSPAGVRPPIELLIELLVHTAFNHESSGGVSLTTSLRSVGFGWLGTWRELNLRLAGQLYSYSRVSNEARDYRSMRACLEAALECWEVVEQLDSRSNADQRRIWRGMRAVSQLYLARQSTSPVGLLTGASVDFGIAQDNGDRTSQHFQLYSETRQRLFALTGDDTHLAGAARCLDDARAEGYDTIALTQERADLLFARGLRAMEVAGARLRRGTEANAADVRSTTSPDDREVNGSGLDILDVEPDLDASAAPRRPFDANALAAARSAFIAAALLRSRSMTMPRPMPMADPQDTTISTIKRGQAWLRAAHAGRLLGLPRNEHVRAAVRDLRRCGEPNAPISGPYWPWALLERARLLIAEGLDTALEEAGQLTLIGLQAAETELGPDAVLTTRLRTLLVEVDLRRATTLVDRAGCRAALPAALAAASDSGRVASSALAYGARVLLPDEGIIEPGDLPIIRQVVDELESRTRQALDQRAFNASHAAALLIRSDGAGPVTTVDRNVQERIHRLLNLAIDATGTADTTDWPGSTAIQFNSARAALRLGRIIAADGTDEARASALPLFSEAVNKLESVATTIDSWDTDDPQPVPGSGDEPIAGFVLDRRQCASLLGDAYLRRDTLRHDNADLSAAIGWLTRSTSLGNDSPEQLSLLGQAYFKVGRRTSDADSLERAVELKARSRLRAAETHGDVAREAYSVGAAAAYSLWRMRGRREDFVTATETAILGAESDITWAWPLLQLADLASASPDTAATLPEEPPHDPATGQPAPRTIWAAMRRGDLAELRTEACRRVVGNTEFMTQVLGGRRRWETYVLDDPHGLLSSTLVLKPAPNRADADRESSRTRAFRQHLAATSAPSWARATQPLAVVDLPESARAVLVSYREVGVELSDLIAQRGTDGGPTAEEVIRAVKRSLELLAIIHTWRGPIPQTAEPDRNVVRALGRELNRMGHRHADSAADRWVQLIPEGLPRVGKRDAHTENWLVTRYGAVVALDLGSSSHLPVGFEVAQLLEDMPLLDCTEEGQNQRLELAEGYLSALAGYWPDIAGSLPDVRSDRWRTAYACFAARRAIFLIDRENQRPAAGLRDRARRDHAESVLQLAIETVPELSVLSWPGS
ncbi:hypothetical protein EV645_3535 [Kribbella rubisoli]|uniref:Uncharacterized protein n=2 Tax=Kribbella rubisoli TaxID=3075929 RepID=A0A4Q7X0L3_9ACTN|nr:hypothetical protein EV645_3535 [Kribbella rubisoli]